MLCARDITLLPEIRAGASLMFNSLEQVVKLFVCFLRTQKCYKAPAKTIILFRISLLERLTNVLLLCVTTRVFLTTTVMVSHVESVVLGNKRLVPLRLFCSLMGKS